MALNYEKHHFMVTEGIVLGNKISIVGLEVDQAKNISDQNFDATNHSERNQEFFEACKIL